MIMISFFPGSQERYLGLNGELTALGKVTKGRGWDDDAHTCLYVTPTVNAETMKPLSKATAKRWS